jgi:hypothetical protein
MDATKFFKLEQVLLIVALVIIPIGMQLVTRCVDNVQYPRLSRPIEVQGYYIDTDKVQYFSPLSAQDMDIATGPYYSFTLVISGAPITIGDFSRVKVENAYNALRRAWEERR